MKKLCVLITICCMLALVSLSTLSCKKKVVTLKTLQEIALTDFDEQMKAVIGGSPDKDVKIKKFEASMTALAEEYYRYYVEETKEGIEAAKTNFTAFLTSFKSPDGIGLSKDSIPNYLERMKKK